MFAYCPRLVKIILPEMPVVQYLNEFISGTSLQTVIFPFLPINCPVAIRSSDTIVKVVLGAVSSDVTLDYLNLSASELNNIFADLAIVSDRTITVTGNWGAANCDQTIASNKGWMVVI
jgi:hypothetical protein